MRYARGLSSLTSLGHAPHLRACVLAAALAGTVATARADEPTATEPPISTARRAAAIAAASLPGLVVPGLGARVIHEPRAANRLLALRAVGVGLMVVGGVPLAITYGSAKLVVPGVHLVVAGSGLFLGGWWADVYTAAGGGEDPTRWRAPLELGATATWWRDAYHGDRALGGVDVRGRLGRWSGAAWLAGAHDGSALIGRVDGAARLWDRAQRRAAHTGTALDVRAAVDVTRERDDRLTLATGELALRGRLILSELDRALTGSFLDLELGAGLVLADYRAGDTDTTATLLARFAWGVFLPCDRGEVSVFYDHRRDSRAGGLAADRAAGFFGSIGADAELALDATWTVAATVEIGSAWVSTLGVRRGWR